MVQESVVVRYPNIDDLEQIVHLNRVSLPENYAVAYFIELIKSWNSTSCVIEVDGKVLGYVIARIERPSLAPWRPKPKSKAHIISVAVSPEHRRRGYARKMMEFVINRVLELQNVTKVTLEVRESNIGAIKLYENMNFISEKTLTRYYSDGENALLMSLELY